MNRDREIRRHAGAVAQGIRRLDFGLIDDPRASCSTPLHTLLTTIMLGLVAGKRSLAETERLTEQLSPTMRVVFGILRRVPDTTMRDLVVHLDPHDLRRVLHDQTRDALRRKQLRPDGLPCGVVSIDGKHTRTPLPDSVFAQRQGDKHILRTLTCALTSARAVTCIDAVPIEGRLGEVSAFGDAFLGLDEAYGHTQLFEFVTTDAGINSLANATLVNAKGYGYVFAIKEDQPTLLAEAERLLHHLDGREALAETVDSLSNREQVRRRVWVTDEIAGYHEWDHLRMAVRVQSETLVDGTVVTTSNRYYVTNATRGRFTGEQWLRVIRGHWGVENDCHCTLDRFFREDDHPWLKDARGMLVVMLLRRLVLNMLLLYKKVSRRADGLTWSATFDWICTTLVAATAAAVEGARWLTIPPRTGRPPPIGHPVAEG